MKYPKKLISKVLNGSGDDGYSFIYVECKRDPLKQGADVSYDYRQNQECCVMAISSSTKADIGTMHIDLKELWNDKEHFSVAVEDAKTGEMASNQ